MLSLLIIFALGNPGECSSPKCDILMMIFGAIGVILLSSFTFYVIRYKIRAREAEKSLSSSLVN